MSTEKKSVVRAVPVLAGALVIGGVLLRRRRSSPPPSARLADTDVLLRAPDVAPRTVDVVTDDGARLRVLEYGDPDATPIVLSHGWTCSADFWAPQINDLADKYRVVVYDQRGHGRSEVGTRPLDPDVLGDDLAAVLAATVRPGAPAVIAGHSMGGMSVMSWASRYPTQVRERAKGILLADTASDSLVRETTVIPLPPGVPQVPARLAASVLGSALPLPATRLSTRALRYATMGARSTPAQVAFCERVVRDCAPRTRGMWGAVLSTVDIVDAVTNIDVPTVVVVGTEDRLTPPIQSRRLAEKLDRANVLDELIELPGVGHMASVEAIAEFDAALVRLADR
ncbi:MULTISPECIES: alpha/beta fold hydrolase [Nocardiaceae]|uniref:Alpha/beta hydrolase n=1 Tax=Rhodococcoides kroppenstedtii TaxID=293050 RepID=A0ABS7NYL4_9NOCA|nr:MULTISPECIES: alpha/beta hydrolase [Rhodococcus]AMY17638.1 Non-heme chloroperoxidase [Rhodococcus sp. PBTS 1]MBY6314194.1 alpha/beta hydrolase [Rhodococcus kroppenstedtii]MBY6321967.1 alpha/beta hydrolase [Rhodococcus kroppenstedtii]MBY6400513.1 alpha/beta hydrolase [Rhodococcus kroppenstedtii]MBY6437395.1 alpha/beta hydrolase [Rhodococcus kroppenstedtii]